MKLARRANLQRFNSPTMLNEDAPFFGATVRDWDQAMTQGLNAKLARIRLLAESGPKRDVTQATTFDVASVAAQLIAGAQ